MITDNGLSVLSTLGKYYVLCRPQIQRICFPHHRDGRSTRKHLLKLVQARFVKKHSNMIPYSGNGSGCPCYYLTQAGAEVLANYHDDDRVSGLNTKAPRADLLFHWLAINDTRMKIESAVKTHNEIQLLGWYSEWQTIFDETGQEKFYLHSVFQKKPPLSCSPDAAFLLEVQGFRKVYYVEQDRNTSGARQIASSKTLGYAELHARQIHKHHFSDCNVDAFTVLVVTTHNGRRNRLADAIDGKPGASMWRFVTQDDLIAEFFPFGEAFINVKRESLSLIRRPDEQKGVA